ncbi:sulfate ABC transporter substrate-binding protein [Microlunatus elymi]|uniref:sulfate ABC transporter substrate-binding protein n=1 Tax=Microlunatus elymi TaxID=2596828 RepID=UPI001D18F296|nr:sulfate ABC transporter substrate-binding protein [Microlunatus elymi]
MVSLSVALAGCVGGSASGSDSGTADGAGGTQLHLVGYSTPKTANDAAEQAFAATDAGKGVTWQESYGASGDQSRAVAGGLAADYVNFSTPPDMTRLADAGIVNADWDSGPTKGIVNDTVVVMVVRPGNPQHITGWDDLVKPGIKIVTPNPSSSGSARWNILAAYQQVITSGGSKADAEAYLKKFFKNVQSLPTSGREATNAFLKGDADVLLSYENEAILARQSGEKLDYLVPSSTLLIETPGAVTKKANAKATDFLHYVLSPAGQAIYQQYGFRPVISDAEKVTVKGANDPNDPFPKPDHLSTVADMGGWPTVSKAFFDPDTGLVPKIQAETGKTQ